MKLHAKYHAREPHDSYIVSVWVDDEVTGQKVHGCMFPLREEVDADRLVQSIQNYASEPTPTNMHWVSSRLRSVGSRDRKAVLRTLDVYMKERSHE